MEFEPPVDLNNCDLEPIHIPGAIQQHGLLVALATDGSVAMASGNLADGLGLSTPPRAGTPLAALVGTAAAERIRALLLESDLDGRDPAHMVMELPSGSCYDVIAHRHDGVTIVEFEPTCFSPSRDYELLIRLQKELDQLSAGEGARQIWMRTARMVRDVTAMDRVMIYRFDDDWHGEVVAEEKRADLDSLLGLHYPATDIPAQARRLYVENRLRFIPNVQYEPVALDAAVHPQTGRPLDLSFAVLRSVSPIHVEYLTNMGVRATLVISLIVEGRLWGLIACHHYAVLPLSYLQRRFAGLIGQSLGLVLAEAHRAQNLEESVGLHEARRKIAAESERDPDVTLETLLDIVRPDLLSAFQAPAVINWSNANWTVHGAGLDRASGDALVAALRRRLTDAGATWSTDRLGELHPELAGLRTVASGVLAVRFDANAASGVAYLRPEQVVEVNWAGDPRKTANVTEEGSYLSPRRSFAVWKEFVRGRSRPWSPAFAHVLHDLAVAGQRIEKNAFHRALRLIEQAASRSSDSILITDARVDHPGPAIAYVNPEFTKLTGYTAEQVLGHTPRMLQCPATDRRQLQRVREAMIRGESCRVELINRRADGSDVRVDMKIDPVQGPDGQISHYVAVQRDITEAHRVQTQLGRLNEELSRRIADEATRLRESLKAIDLQDRTIARDLRAPMQAISAFTRRLAENFGGNASRGAPLIERINANVARMASLVDELAAFHDSSARVLASRIACMGDLARDEARELARDWPDVEIHVESLPDCHGEPALLRQLWRNVLATAAREAYRRKPARLTVSFADGFYRVVGPSNGRASMEELSRIFDRLNEADKFFGSGIAIVLVERIVALHRGHVYWESLPERMACIRFSVALMPGAARDQG